MKFNKAIIPELSGISNFDSLLSDEKTYVSFVKAGLPFVITGGDILDQYGVPFKNLDFKKDFSDIIYKSNISKMTILGRLCYKSLASVNPNELNRFRVLFRENGDYTSIKNDVLMELSELIFNNNDKIPFKARHMSLVSFGGYISSTHKRVSVEKLFPVEALTEENAKRFIKYSISSNSPILIRKDYSTYIQGSDDIKELNMVIFNPFQLKLLKVDNIVGHERTTVGGEKEYVLSEVDVRYRGTIHCIDASMLKQGRVDFIRDSKYMPQRLYLEFLIAEDETEIKKIKFA